MVGMRGAHEDDGPLFWYFPTTPRMHFSEEELDQNRECPQKRVVDPFVHDRELLARGVSLDFCHGG